jgi:ABC-2 type transport system ATP-binding protein
MTDKRPGIAELTRVTHRYGRTTALDAIDFTVHAGEVVALLGPNGAGKTTAVRLLLGLMRATEGGVALWGRAPTDHDVRRRVGVMLQVGRVPETLTVREHVHLFSSYYGTPVPVMETLSIAGVTDFADRRFGHLSADSASVRCSPWRFAVVRTCSSSTNRPWGWTSKRAGCSGRECAP